MSRRARHIALAPAKVNLGLEVARRRPDGYHDIVTIMQAISLFDRFEWTNTGGPFEYIGPRDVEPERDLVARVFDDALDRANWTGRLRLIKRAPVAAGLGGGSSDAALALRLAWPEASDVELRERAMALGSDVPFFLRGGTALATGVGANLESLATPLLWFVLVTPPLEIAEKTRSLYQGLASGDFSGGARVRSLCRAWAETALPELPNAFSRQMLAHPAVRYAYDCLSRGGAEHVSISGAGPTIYAVMREYNEATRVAARLPRAAGRVAIARSIAARVDDPGPRRMAAALRGCGAHER